MSDMDSAFEHAVVGQLPSRADRIKKALRDPGVIYGFESTEKESFEYIEFLGFVASEYLLFPDELDEISYRIDRRLAVSKNG